MRMSHLMWVLVLIAAVVASPAHAGFSSVDAGVEFTYSDPYAASVSLAGAFNNWDVNADPMTVDDEGVWSVVIDLAPGVYEYKFVLNGSQWVADPDNPKTAGDYGNSEMTVGEDGGVVVAAQVAPISNTAVNSRVSLNGWYRATYDTESDLPSDPRWRLTRPEHEVFVSVNPTVTSKVTGGATLRLATGAGDIKEIHADLYSGYARLEGGPFTVTGFYNEERVQFDNPLETLGHTDLTGTIAEEHIPYGCGTQGAIIESDFWGLDLAAVYANAYDYDTYNDPSTYDNTDTDLIGVRLKRPLGPLGLGATYVSFRDGWWMDWQGDNYSPHLQEFIDETGSSSDWFELSNEERYMGVDLDWQVHEALLGLRAEYSSYRYASIWNMGNREEVDGDDYGNGVIGVEAGEMTGSLVKLELESRPLESLRLDLEVGRTSMDGMDAGEEYVAFGSPVWAGDPLRRYTEVRFDASPLSVNVYDALPERNDWLYELEADFTFGIFELLFEYDRATYDWTYAPDSTDVSLAWEGTVSRVAPRFRANISEDKLWIEVEAEAMSYDLDDGLWDAYDTTEVDFRAWFSFARDWGILLDARQITYKDVPDSTGAGSDESFMQPYMALVYSPRKNIELRLGYGVNPLGYVDVPVEGRANGRERWRSDYLWNHSAAGVLDAEQALADARTIGLMAVISF